MAKVGILDFTLLFTLKAFTIIYMYDIVIYNKVVFGIILKGKLNTFTMCMVLESSNCSVKQTNTLIETLFDKHFLQFIFVLD